MLRLLNPKKIYILVRPKKKDPIERLKSEILNSSVFEYLKSQRDDFYEYAISKLHVIEGDMLNDEIITHEEDKNLLIETVEIVIHCAATVRFDEPLDYALRLNVLGALKLLDLAKKFKKITSFVHTSTAYVNCNRGLYLEEKIYDLDFDPEEKFSELINTPKNRY